MGFALKFSLWPSFSTRALSSLEIFLGTHTWTITSSDETAKVVDVVVHNTNGCHLYYIDAVIDNTVTGIQTVTTTKENGAYYDLQGRRVAQPTKGLYILNGKKVMIK